MNTQLFRTAYSILFACVTLIHYTHAAERHKPIRSNRYTLIESLYAGSLQETEPHLSKKEQKKTLSQCDRLPALGPDALLNGALQVIKKTMDSFDPIPQTEVTSAEVWKNLELFTTTIKTKDKSVLGSFKKTYTAAGEIVLTRILLDPTTNIQSLTSRQELIQQLLTNHELYASIKTLLKEYKQEEQNILNFAFPSDPLYNNFITQIFEQPGANLAPNFGKIWPITLGSAILGAGPFGLFLINNMNESKVSKLALSGCTLLMMAGSAFSIWMATTQSKIVMYAHRRLVALNHYFKTLDHIINIQNNLNCSDIRILSQKYVTESVLTLKELTDILKKSTFNLHQNMGIKKFGGALSTNYSNIIKGMRALKKARPTLLNGLSIIGHLDAYFSLARMIKEQQIPAKAHWCLVNYLEDTQRPFIKAIDFWHPTVSATAAVLNSLTLGGNEDPQTIVISGVNQGGKSTAMKALAICCILGQTCGIAPAKEFSFTPFSTINTYLNITDDVSAQQSLFSAEITRAQTLLTQVKNLPSHRFALTLLDEICTGTERIEGEALAYSIAEKLGTYPNSITLIASHFPALTELESLNTKMYKNMKVLAIQNADSTFTFPYTLMNGKTSQQIGPELLEKIGLPSIMTQKMRDVLANPDNYTYRGDA